LSFEALLSVWPVPERFDNFHDSVGKGSGPCAYKTRVGQFRIFC